MLVDAFFKFCMSVHGTFRTSRDVRVGSAMRSKADVDACEAEQRMTVTVMIVVAIFAAAVFAVALTMELEGVATWKM